MLTEQRKQWLLARLKKDARIVAKDASEELLLSEDTIRRDLRELAADGLLMRVHGGALPASPTVQNLAARRSMATEEKTRLGRAAVKLLRRGQTAFVDGGTTNLELIRNLPLDYQVTVVTHSPSIAAALEFHASVSVRMIGGTLFRHSMVMVGAAALEAINVQRFDVSFIGVTGIDPKEGLTTGDYEESVIKKAAVARSGDVVTMVTAEKIGAISRYAVAPLKSLTSLAVSKEAKLNAEEYAGIEIIRA